MNFNRQLQYYKFDTIKSGWLQPRNPFKTNYSNQGNSVRRVLFALLKCFHSLGYDKGYEASICEEIQIWKLWGKTATVYISHDGR